MKKISLTIVGSFCAGAVILSGCGSETVTEPEVNEVTATAETFNGEPLEIPETVEGPPWCEDVYVAYFGSDVSNPFLVSQTLTEVAAEATNEPDAQEVFTNFATLILSRNPATTTEPPTEEEVNQYIEAEQEFNEVFEKYCGGESLDDIFYEQNNNPELEEELALEENSQVVEDSGPS